MVSQRLTVPVTPPAQENAVERAVPLGLDTQKNGFQRWYSVALFWQKKHCGALSRRSLAAAAEIADWATHNLNPATHCFVRTSPISMSGRCLNTQR
jgi:hypothetical protein